MRVLACSAPANVDRAGLLTKWPTILFKRRAAHHLDERKMHLGSVTTSDF
jgi:hypothetical protein